MVLLKRLNLYDNGVVSTLYICFTLANNNVNIDYIEQYFEAQIINYSIYLIAYEGARNHGLLNISIDDFFNIEIPIPPLEEQKKIADILLTWDKAITTLKEIIQQKELQKKGLMQNLLTGKKRLDGFNDEWKEVKLGEIGEITSAGVDKKINNNETKIYLLNYMDIYNNNFLNNNTTRYITTATNNKIASCNIKQGDIFITPSSEVPTDIAHTAVAEEDIVDTVYSYHIMRLRPKITISLYYSKYMFETSYFYKQAYTLCSGSGQRYVLSINTMRNIKLYIPTSIEEQKKIAEILMKADEEIELLNKQLELYTEQKKGLMQQLLTGKIRVN